MDETWIATLALLRPGMDTAPQRRFKEIWRPDIRPEEAADLMLEAARVPASDRRRRLEAAREQARLAIRAAGRAQIRFTWWGDAGYPAALGTIPDPPIGLWSLGRPDAVGGRTIAVVGSRDASPAGLATARRLGRDLALAGVTVVSGLARGADGAAHEGTLEARGRTIAVLGSGPDVIYPPGHRSLAARIQDSGGALVSEFPPGVPPLPWHFPLRNRIIAGLSRAVVVVEASERSGSLITARAALEQGRDVLAVPGGVASGRHRGCHALIKDGARLVETVDDILEEVGWRRADRPSSLDSGKASQLSYLRAFMPAGQPVSLDQIVAQSGREAPAVLAELAALELLGSVCRTAGGHFAWLDGPAIDG